MLLGLATIAAFAGAVWGITEWRAHVEAEAQIAAAAARAESNRVAREARIAEYKREGALLSDAMARWKDLFDLAKSTSRIALSGPVMQMQELKRSTAKLELSECMGKSRDSFVRHMDLITGAFMAFMQQDEAGQLAKLGMATKFIEHSIEYMAYCKKAAEAPAEP